MISRRRGQPAHQVVDPSVSRAKFEHEVGIARAREPEYRRRGCVILSANFPHIELLFGVPQVRPSALLFVVILDFTNYDAEPPSVQFINPWTRTVLRAAELLSVLRLSLDPTEPRRLLQWWTAPHDVPFLCMRGVREYHRNPGHTGDSWWLHRARGEGTPARLIEVLTTYGPEQIAGYDVRILVKPLPDGRTEMRNAMGGFSVRTEPPPAPPHLEPPLPSHEVTPRAS